MAVWYSLWSFGRFFPFWYVWTKKNLATVLLSSDDQHKSGTLSQNKTQFEKNILERHFGR
jgi:hypothetical protein